MFEPYQPDISKDDPGPTWPFILVGLLLVAALAAGGVWFWFHRDVSVTINGRTVNVTYRSSFDDVCAAAGVEPKSGDLYSITGNLIGVGRGEPYTVTLDGSELTDDELRAVAVEGFERITVTNGGDVTEEYKIVEHEVLPQLVPPISVRSVTFVRQWGVSGTGRFRVGVVSGEEILEEVIQTPQNCILDSVNPKPSEGRMLVCLTFDDGPSAYTADILKILKDKGVRATFFCPGYCAENWPDTTASIQAAGCEVMSHTMNHWDHFETTPEETYAEVSEGFAVLHDYAGVSTTVIRPPYGNWNEHCWLSTRGAMSASIIWNVDSHDWDEPGAKVIIDICTNGIDSGDIILMHDGGGDRSQTIEALPVIIDKLREQGFEFVTVSELMASDPRIPSEVARQYAPMPEGCDWPVEIVE